MPNHSESLAEIHQLCENYSIQLQKNRQPSYVSLYFPEQLTLKIDILNVLSSAKDINQILALLHPDRNPSYNALLRESNDNWLSFLLKAVLVCLTLPLSLPILMLSSWTKHGTMNFLKSEGSMFVEKILDIGKRSVSTMKQDESTNRTAPEHESEDRNAPEVESSEYQHDASGDSDDRPQYRAGQRPEEKIYDEQEHFESNDADEAPKSDEYDEFMAQQQQLSLINAAPPARPNAFRDPEEGLTHGLMQFNALLAPWLNGLLRLKYENALDRETGDPVITSYRINKPDEAQTGTFSIDIKSKFKWTSQPAARITLQFFDFLDIPDNYQVLQGQGPKRNVPPPPPSATEQWLNMGVSLFKKPERADLHELLKQARELCGIDKKEALCLKAYKLAKNDLEYTLVLESLIDAYGDYLQYIRDYLCRYAAKGSHDILIARTQTGLDRYRRQLPEHYRTIVPSAKKLAEQYRTIYTLIKNQQIDEAWALFAAMPSKLSPFIQYAFPNLSAMENQLWAIFTLTRHNTMNGSQVSIAEEEVVGVVKHILKESCELIAPFNPLQKAQIEEQLIRPLEQLSKLGKQAAEHTSYEERVAIRKKQIEARIAGIRTTWRIPGEDMDAEDEPQVVELTCTF